MKFKQSLIATWGVVFIALNTLFATAAHAEDAPIVAPAASDPFENSDVFLWTAVGFQMAHQIDHFGRADFSAPSFMFPLAFYATHLGGRYLFDRGTTYFVLVDSLWLTFFSITHFSGLIETPESVFNKWTVERGNAFHAHSAEAGRTAQIVIVGAAASISAHLGVTLLEGWANGFSWRRREQPPKSSLALVPKDRGAGLLWSRTW